MGVQQERSKLRINLDRSVFSPAISGKLKGVVNPEGFAEIYRTDAENIEGDVCTIYDSDPRRLQATVDLLIALGELLPTILDMSTRTCMILPKEDPGKVLDFVPVRVPAVPEEMIRR
jgi:hypothetical protein